MTIKELLANNPAKNEDVAKVDQAFIAALPKTNGSENGGEEIDYGALGVEIGNTLYDLVSTHSIGDVAADVFAKWVLSAAPKLAEATPGPIGKVAKSIVLESKLSGPLLSFIMGLATRRK